MSPRRSYGSYNDGCASAHALDLIGERWALIVVRELLLGPKRFGDLQRDVLGIGPGVLTQRPTELEAAGVLVRRRLPRPASATVYELTEWGRGLEAVNNALSAWAVRSPALPLEADMSPDTLVLAMRAHARPLPAGAAAGPITVLLDLIDSRTAGPRNTDSRNADARNADAQAGAAAAPPVPVTYLATLGPEHTTVERADTIAAPTDEDAASAKVRVTTRAWKAHVIGGAPLGDVAGVDIDGDRSAVEQLLAAVRL